MRNVKDNFSESAKVDAPSKETPTHRSKPKHVPEPPRRVGKFEIKATGDEARNYDFAAARPPAKNTNFIESAAHMAKGCLGAGLVAIHQNYARAGLWTALILNVVLGILLTYCIHILVQSAQKLYGRVQEPKLSYPDVAEAAAATSPFLKVRKFDKVARHAVDSVIMIDLFGSCVAYLVVIARSLKQLIENTDAKDQSYIRLYILALLIVCIPITWILEFKYLAPFSIVANLFLCVVVIATVVYGSMAASTSPLNTTAFPPIKSWQGVFTYMGGCVFAMEGVGVSMPIENYMANPKRFPQVLVAAMTVVISMVMAVGFFGYWGYGDDSMAPVTMNFSRNWFSIILKVLMALVIYVTFALNFWVPFDLAWYYIKRKIKPEKYWFWHRFWRTVFVIGIVLITVAFPSVDLLIDVIGAFCLSNMGFIFPSLIELSVDWFDPGPGRFYWRLWKCVAICVFGAVLCIIGTTTSVISLIHELYG
ncbi:hypothetical protein JYU34_022284 [Plutella xylostella]|uniref:Amino acid transporter transmembrane domain-containing protein n=2 Tax=Plutella xylostella TaxID=51655 RepID=A0ABQ7PQW4_PLUXY|nr:hypothetical protein JYU34_022284 [Plutella xylostella]